MLGWVELSTLQGCCSSPEIAQLFPVSVSTSTRPTVTKRWLVLPEILRGTRWSCCFGSWLNDWEDPKQPQVCVHWSFLSVLLAVRRAGGWTCRGQVVHGGCAAVPLTVSKCTLISSFASLMASASRLAGNPYFSLLCCAAQHGV